MNGGPYNPNRVDYTQVPTMLTRYVGAPFGTMGGFVFVCDDFGHPLVMPCIEAARLRDKMQTTLRTDKAPWHTPTIYFESETTRAQAASIAADYERNAGRYHGD